MRWQTFLVLNTEGLYRSSREEKRDHCLVFTSSTKREIKDFYIVVVQWRQRNLHKSVMQSCCFANRELKLERRRRSFKTCVRAAPNFIARIPSRSIRQMLANFSGVEFQRTVSKFSKRKRRSSRVHVLHKTGNKAVSRRCRATTARKGTKSVMHV